MLIDFCVEQVSNIIKKLHPNKAYGHDKFTYVENMWEFNKTLATIFKIWF